METTQKVRKPGRPKKDVDPGMIDSQVNDVKMTVSEFMNLIVHAQANGMEYVEATPEIIAHYNLRGLGTNPSTGKPNEFFIYGGIKVYPIGMKEKIEAEQATPLHYKLHGDTEGKVEGIG